MSDYVADIDESQRAWPSAFLVSAPARRFRSGGEPRRDFDLAPRPPRRRLRIAPSD
jgi:hypothetical protein